MTGTQKSRLLRQQLHTRTRWLVFTGLFTVGAFLIVFHKAFGLSQIPELIKGGAFVPKVTLVSDLKRGDAKLKNRTIYEMGRYGDHGISFMPELHAEFMRIMMNGDEIHYKTLENTVERILGTREAKDKTLEKWKDEWNASHLELAIERGWISKKSQAKNNNETATITNSQ